ncbi:MAG: hypothetical protein EHM64_10690 [Ignavibacteriae bacterium]|nr:MAG: hypothetical protein EHM64_10690 [Ignavibacteriota bacterium]
MAKQHSIQKTIPAIKINQWLPKWDKVQFSDKELQNRPLKYSYLFSMKASYLKALTGVYRRSTKGGLQRSKDPNVQRGHEEERSRTIREFVQYGYPWCEMSESKRQNPEYSDLRKPGWLPTAILINILPPNTSRNGKEIFNDDLVKLQEQNDFVKVQLPKSFTGANWQPKYIYPFEVIDGQHRLWAFDGFDPGDEFELPVVAFYGLAPGWQAYLFWSVNITPKKINRSLAFDLYPLLRQQSWLDKFSGHSIYRETRCQELVEALWSHPESPWYHRINMLGEIKEQRDYKGPSVSQAAWVRSLMASFVKQVEGTGTRMGGLFGAPSDEHKLLFPWNRPMQAAFLIFAGIVFKEQIEKSKSKWAYDLRRIVGEKIFKDDDPAFYGEYSLTSTDQGIRGFLFTVNDLCFVSAKELGLREWNWEDVYGELKNTNVAATEEALVTAAIKSLKKSKVAKFIEEMTIGLSSYDWRTSSTPKLSDDERLRQSVFRGSSGYKEMRRQLLVHLSKQNGRVSNIAKKILKTLKY